jgi:hypothetical protein
MDLSPPPPFSGLRGLALLTLLIWAALIFLLHLKF